jgi:hypothetical protein
MKNAIITLIVISLASAAAVAQNHKNNYKMPYQAKKVEDKDAVVSKYAAEKNTGTNSQANYKAQAGVKKSENAGAEFNVIPIDVNVVGVAGQNQKAQFKGSKKGQNIKQAEPSSQPVVTNKISSPEN